MYGVYTSNRSNTTMVIPQFEYNNTDWVRINITGVSGSMIYQVYTLHFKNGSETSFNFKTDVNPANESNLIFYEKGVPICATNLGAGDTLPTAQLTINETIIRAYPSGSRETNHAAWNSSDDWGNCYFDKETGMLVELCRTHKFTNNVTTEIVEKMDVIKMLSSNRWEINVSPPIASLFVFLTVAIFALLSLVILIHKLGTKKHATTLPLKKWQVRNN
jgi:hypothetical protein